VTLSHWPCFSTTNNRCFLLVLVRAFYILCFFTGHQDIPPLSGKLGRTWSPDRRGSSLLVTTLVSMERAAVPSMNDNRGFSGCKDVQCESRPKRSVIGSFLVLVRTDPDPRPERGFELLVVADPVSAQLWSSGLCEDTLGDGRGMRVSGAECVKHPTSRSQNQHGFSLSPVRLSREFRASGLAQVMGHEPLSLSTSGRRSQIEFGACASHQNLSPCAWQMCQLTTEMERSLIGHHVVLSCP